MVGITGLLWLITCSWSAYLKIDEMRDMRNVNCVLRFMTMARCLLIRKELEHGRHEFLEPKMCMAAFLEIDRLPVAVALVAITTASSTEVFVGFPWTLLL